MTIDEAVRSARRRLAAAGLPHSGLDARVLARFAFALEPTDLVARGDAVADPLALAAFERVVGRRLSGEPVGRILGRREFHGLMLALSADTLEPRPDTETLVDVVVAAVRRGELPDVAPDGSGLTFVDVGTGSGAIAIALAIALPASTGIATDIAEGALAMARVNAQTHGVAARIAFRRGDYLGPVDEPVALIVSNPPYVESAEIATLAAEVRDHDPHLALDGGIDGLDAYRAIAAMAPDRLLRSGLLAVEIGATQAAAVSALFFAAGLAKVEVHDDIERRDRVVTAQAP